MKDRGFVDLHTHTFLSDGGLLPSELVRRVVVRGCRGLAITDHADSSNLELVVASLLKATEELGDEWDTVVIPGVELTHVPPRKIPLLTENARRLGARWVVVHGETVVEPVAPGTNAAAVEARVDLLAHPGLISQEEAAMAAQAGIYLEITSRKGHSLTNGWVAQRARETGALLLLNTDTHSPEDILDWEGRMTVAKGAGLSAHELDRLWENAEAVVARLRRQG
jgi:histidinol phosphatase-like PHP family hydrolase